MELIFFSIIAFSYIFKYNKNIHILQLYKHCTVKSIIHISINSMNNIQIFFRLSKKFNLSKLIMSVFTHVRNRFNSVHLK